GADDVVGHPHPSPDRQQRLRRQAQQNAGRAAMTAASEQLAAEIKNRAKSLGFDLVGITTATPSKYRQYYRDWLDDGRAGTMEYLHRRFDERTDPATYMPGAKSVICVAVNYHTK